jgi:hypothetical protein
MENCTELFAANSKIDEPCVKRPVSAIFVLVRHLGGECRTKTKMAATGRCTQGSSCCFISRWMRFSVTPLCDGLPEIINQEWSSEFSAHIITCIFFMSWQVKYKPRARRAFRRFFKKHFAIVSILAPYHSLQNWKHDVLLVPLSTPRTCRKYGKNMGKKMAALFSDLYITAYSQCTHI